MIKYGKNNVKRIFKWLDGRVYDRELKDDLRNGKKFKNGQMVQYMMENGKMIALTVKELKNGQMVECMMENGKVALEMDLENYNFLMGNLKNDNGKEMKY